MQFCVTKWKSSIEASGKMRGLSSMAVFLNNGSQTACLYTSFEVQEKFFNCQDWVRL